MKKQILVSYGKKSPKYKKVFVSTENGKLRDHPDIEDFVNQRSNHITKQTKYAQ